MDEGSGALERKATPDPPMAMSLATLNRFDTLYASNQ